MEVRLRRKIKKLYLFFFGTKKYEKVVIICRSRTGSNYLISLLNNQYGVQFTGEIFRRLHGRNTLKIWNAFFGSKRKSVKYVGFKLFYDHPFDSDDRTVWKKIEEDNSIKIIHLVRNNIVRSIVSKKIAEETDAWVYKEGQSQRKISIDPQELMHEFNHTRAHEKRIREKYSSREYLEISYEELTTSTNVVMKRVGEFVGFQYLSKKSQLKKQNKGGLQELIVNFHTLQETIKDPEIVACLKE
ncbi:hypothetical protein [Cochleicola gelatinilyticus]|uniref:Sulfotransferase domain-containing protein n=1 Tax=Cochleicola gelatinilyticus TaxID=1763537 RepID=A0A167EP25_9FLAO|nr:hypothetical protein [Cochleicola gelatinilyticus]OAB75733.1 hypothetical protein ULVI_14760 [Cochleicola gelatinilyticus]